MPSLRKRQAFNGPDEMVERTIFSMEGGHAAASRVNDPHTSDDRGQGQGSREHGPRRPSPPERP